MISMVCCFSHSVLTKAERDAVARLREQRADGRAPGSAAHTATVHRMDPIVTFYNHHLKQQQKPSPTSSASSGSGALTLRRRHPQQQQQRRVKPPPSPNLKRPPLATASGTLLFPGGSSRGNGGRLKKKVHHDGDSVSDGEKETGDEKEQDKEKAEEGDMTGTGRTKRLMWHVHDKEKEKEKEKERRLESDLASSSISSATTNTSNFSVASASTSMKPPMKPPTKPPPPPPRYQHQHNHHHHHHRPHNHHAPECYSSSPNLLRREANKLLRNNGSASASGPAATAGSVPGESFKKSGRSSPHHHQQSQGHALVVSVQSKHKDKHATSANSGGGGKHGILQDVGATNTFITAAAQTALRRRATDATSSDMMHPHHPRIGRSSSTPRIVTQQQQQHGRGNASNRIKEGSTALLGALRTLGSWHTPIQQHQQQHRRKQQKAIASGNDGSDDDRSGSEGDGKGSSNKQQNRQDQQSIGRLASAGLRKKLDRVRVKLIGSGASSATVETGGKHGSGRLRRTTAVDNDDPDSPVDSADRIAESTNDAYFQELMRGD